MIDNPLVLALKTSKGYTEEYDDSWTIPFLENYMEYPAIQTFLNKVLNGPWMSQADEMRAEVPALTIYEEDEKLFSYFLNTARALESVLESEFADVPPDIEKFYILTPKTEDFRQVMKISGFTPKLLESVKFDVWGFYIAYPSLPDALENLEDPADDMIAFELSELNRAFPLYGGYLTELRQTYVVEDAYEDSGGLIVLAVKRLDNALNNFTSR